MSSQHMRPRCLSSPTVPEVGKIIHPYRKILDMTGHCILAEPTRTGLSAPIGGRHPPARAVPLLQRFEVFFVSVAPPGKKQDGAARLLRVARPVDTAQRMAIGSVPAAFLGVGGYDPAINRRWVSYRADFSLRAWLLFGKH